MTKTFDSISELILEIYRAAREMPIGEFENFMLEMVRSLVPFDSSRWVTVELVAKRAIAHYVHLINEPTNVVLDWESINRTDKLLHAVVANPGKAYSVHTKTYYAGHEYSEMRDYTQRYRHANSLVISKFTATPSIAEGLSLYRARQEACFDEHNRRVVEQLMPHMVEAMATNRAMALLQAGTLEPAPERTAVAILGANGQVRFAGSGFNHFLRLEWPDWTGPQLPAELQESLARVGDPGYAGASIQVVALSRIGGLLFLKAGRLSLVKRLSERELAVARLFGTGMSHKDVARQLELSPATVRNVVQRIYAKLEISDKAELAALVVQMEA